MTFSYQPDEGYDAVADVRAMRDEDNRISDANWARRFSEMESSEESDEDVTRRLLTELGLNPSSGAAEA